MSEQEATTVAAAAAAAPTTPTAPSVTAPVSEPDEPQDAEMEETVSPLCCLGSQDDVPQTCRHFLLFFLTAIA